MTRSVLATFAVLLPLLCGVASCGDLSDNVSYVIISNPGGSFDGSGGGAVIAIRLRSTGRTAGVGHGLAATTQRVVSVAGLDDDGNALTVHLPTQSDGVVLERADRFEVGAPALRRGTLLLPGARLVLPNSGAAALTLEVADAATVDALGRGPGRLHFANGGSMLVLESLAGIAMFDTRPNPQVFPPGSTLDLSGRDPLVTTPDRRLVTLFSPPQPRPQERVESAGTGALRILGPRGQSLAVLPEQRVELQAGAMGLFFTASFPGGLVPGDPPFSLSMAEHNRYLLRVEAR